MDHEHPTFLLEDNDEEGLQRMFWAIAGVLVVGVVLSAVMLWRNIRKVE